MEQLYIIKIGGNVIDNEAQLAQTLKDFAGLPAAKMLVHGGGKIATEVSAKLNIPTRMVEGRRITDADTLKVVTMVYGGLVNKNVVAKLQAHGCNAIGMTGADGNSIPADSRPVKEIDYGYVGDVKPQHIQTDFLQLLIDNRLVPVFAALTHDSQGNLLNTNADTIASSLAISLATQYEVHLVYCFEKKGVLADVQDEDSVIAEIDTERYSQLKSDGVIFQGMIPKLDNAFQAIEQGVKEVVICHANALPQLMENGFEGTRLLKQKEESHAASLV